MQLDQGGQTSIIKKKKKNHGNTEHTFKIPSYMHKFAAIGVKNPEICLTRSTSHERKANVWQDVKWKATLPH